VSSALVWFRKDLRLTDNPAWAAATTDHRKATAVFIVDPRLWEPARSHRRVQLTAHLHALARRQEARHRLRLTRVLAQFCTVEIEASAVPT
jgi:deoxyribodipyrimidine photo-lyase